jgi:hypothetical protein
VEWTANPTVAPILKSTDTFAIVLTYFPPGAAFGTTFTTLVASVNVGALSAVVTLPSSMPSGTFSIASTVQGSYFSTSSFKVTGSANYVEVPTGPAIAMYTPTTGQIIAPGTSFTVKWTSNPSATPKTPSTSTIYFYLTNLSNGANNGFTVAQLGTAKIGAGSATFTCPGKLKAGSYAVSVMLANQYYFSSPTFTIAANTALKIYAAQNPALFIFSPNGYIFFPMCILSYFLNFSNNVILASHITWASQFLCHGCTMLLVFLPYLQQQKLHLI